MDQNILNGPTGETCLDLPSPYQAHRFGLLHLPRFIAKIKNILTGIYPLVTKEISPKDLMVFYAYI